MTDPIGERGRQGAAPLGGTMDIEKVRMALEHAADTYQPLVPSQPVLIWTNAEAALSRIERVVEAAKALMARQQLVIPSPPVGELVEALGALDG